jgi:hypothetical protein
VDKSVDGLQALGMANAEVYVDNAYTFFLCAGDLI